MTGTVDPTDETRGVPAMMKEMRAAGFDEIVTEAQAQIDAMLDFAAQYTDELIARVEQQMTMQCLSFLKRHLSFSRSSIIPYQSTERKRITDKFP